MESSDEPQCGDIERVVMTHLLAMPARAFAGEGDNGLPAGVAAAPAVVREALREVASHTAQAAAVARLARASRAGNQLAEASALAAPARSVRRAKMTALCDIVVALSEEEMINQSGLHGALVAICANDLMSPSYASAADKAEGWRQMALGVREVCGTGHETQRDALVLSWRGVAVLEVFCRDWFGRPVDAEPT